MVPTCAVRNHCWNLATPVSPSAGAHWAKSTAVAGIVRPFFHFKEGTAICQSEQRVPGSHRGLIRDVAAAFTNGVTVEYPAGFVERDDLEPPRRTMASSDLVRCRWGRK